MPRKNPKAIADEIPCKGCNLPFFRTWRQRDQGTVTHNQNCAAIWRMHKLRVKRYRKIVSIVFDDQSKEIQTRIVAFGIKCWREGRHRKYDRRD